MIVVSVRTFEKLKLTWFCRTSCILYSLPYELSIILLISILLFNSKNQQFDYFDYKKNIDFLIKKLCQSLNSHA